MGCCSTLAALQQRAGRGSGSPDALLLLDGLALQRSLVVDRVRLPRPDRLARPPCCASPARHPDARVEIRDPREQELADVGELRLVDPETGRQLRVDTADPRSPHAFRANGRRDDRGARRMLYAAGVRHVALSTDGDWLQPLALFLNRSDRR